MKPYGGHPQFLNYQDSVEAEKGISGKKNGSESAEHKPTFHLEPVDLLAGPPLLKIDFALSTGEKNTVEVVFINKDGKPFSEWSETVLASAYFPKTARFPTEKTKHALLYGSRSAVLVIVIKEKKKDISLQHVRSLGGMVTRLLAKEPFTDAYVYFDVFAGSSKMKCEGALHAFIHGLQTPTYRFDDLKQKKDDEMKLKHISVHASRVSFEREIEIRDFVNGLVCAEHLSRRWVDMPAQVNCFSTTDVTRLVHEIYDRNREIRDVLELEEIHGEALNQNGLNALWSVGKGRMPEAPPALLILKYMGAGERKPIVAFVGKCLVFDTGGEQIKPDDGMLGMKADMGGAAAVLAAFNLLVTRRAKVNVVATLAVADNAISSHSYHAGDVVRTYRGKTVEVTHTDAEGRLALADAIAYTEVNYKPDSLITLATLTGAAVVALGHEFAALYGKTNRMVDTLKSASGKTWNKAWHMPLNESEHAVVKPSQIADTTNLGDRPGGSISAAKFVMSFAETKHVGHLDIAPVAMEGYDATDVQQKCSGGWGPALLWEAAHLLGKRK